MNFSELLGRLLALSDGRAKELAQHLDYTPSLITRWTHGQNLPRASTAEEVFRKSTAFFVKSCTNHSALTEFLELPANTSEDVISEALYHSLHRAYGVSLGISSDSGLKVFETSHAFNLQDAFAKIYEFVEPWEPDGDVHCYSSLSNTTIHELLAAGITSMYPHETFQVYHFARHHLSQEDIELYGEIAHQLNEVNTKNRFHFCTTGAIAPYDFFYVPNQFLLVHHRLYQTDMYSLFFPGEMLQKLSQDLDFFLQQSHDWGTFSPCNFTMMQEALAPAKDAEDLKLLFLNAGHLALSFSLNDQDVMEKVPATVIPHLYYLRMTLDFVREHPDRSLYFMTDKAQLLSALERLQSDIFGQPLKINPAMFRKMLLNLIRYLPAGPKARYYFMTPNSNEVELRKRVWIASTSGVSYLRAEYRASIEHSLIYHADDPSLRKALNEAFEDLFERKQYMEYTLQDAMAEVVELFNKLYPETRISKDDLDAALLDNVSFKA